MNLPVEVFPLASCRYTRGEAIFFFFEVDSSDNKITLRLYVCRVWYWSRSLILCVPFRMDATLKELTSLVKEVYPEARKKGTHFSFNIVYPDPRGKVYRLVSYFNNAGCIHEADYLCTVFIDMHLFPLYRLKDIGSTVSGRKGTDDSLTLQSQRFQIGDYLDIAITPPNRAPPLSTRMRPFWANISVNFVIFFFSYLDDSCLILLCDAK